MYVCVNCYCTLFLMVIPNIALNYSTLLTLDDTVDCFHLLEKALQQAKQWNCKLIFEGNDIIPHLTKSNRPSPGMYPTRSTYKFDDDPNEISFKFSYGDFKSEFDNMYKYACTNEGNYKKALKRLRELSNEIQADAMAMQGKDNLVPAAPQGELISFAAIHKAKKSVRFKEFHEN